MNTSNVEGNANLLVTLEDKGQAVEKLYLDKDWRIVSVKIYQRSKLYSVDQRFSLSLIGMLVDNAQFEVGKCLFVQYRHKEGVVRFWEQPKWVVQEIEPLGPIVKLIDSIYSEVEAMKPKPANRKGYSPKLNEVLAWIGVTSKNSAIRMEVIKNTANFYVFDVKKGSTKWKFAYQWNLYEDALIDQSKDVIDTLLEQIQDKTITL